MHDVSWLIAANALVWCGLGLYLFLLHRRGCRLAERMELLERASSRKETA